MVSFRCLSSSIFCLFIFATSNAVSNALFSIACAMLGICVVYQQMRYCKTKMTWPQKGVQVPYWLFFGLLLLASLILGDKNSIKKAFDFWYWSIPFWLVFFACKNKEDEKSFYFGLAGSVLFVSLVSVYQFFLLPFGTPIKSLYGQHNHFSTMLVLNLPFLVMPLFKKQILPQGCRNIVLLSAIMGCFSLLLTLSRGGIIGFFLSGFITIFFLIVNKSIEIYKIKHLLMSLLLLTIIFSGAFCYINGGWTRGSDNERNLLLQSSYAMWQDHKLAGIGLGNWRQEYAKHYILPQAKEPNLDMPHNNVAYFFSTTGILGGVGYLAFIVGVLTYLYKMIKKQPGNIFLQALLWSVLAITIHGMVDVGITFKAAFRLLSALMGFTMAFINLYDE